jgi:hypothetical protein
MKKFKFLKIFGLAMIVSLAVYNVGLALNVNKSGDISLNNVEQLAEADGFWAGILDGLSNTLQGQGWTKDEKTTTRGCPTSTSTSFNYGITVTYNGATATYGGGYSNSQTNPPDRKEIICLVGSENCSSKKC